MSHIQFGILFSYEINALLTLTNTTKLAASTIVVNPDVVVRVQFKDSAFQDIPSGHGFKVSKLFTTKTNLNIFHIYLVKSLSLSLMI